MNGYTGHVLRIDLSKGSIRVLEDAYINEYESFIGGSGLAAKILFDEVKLGIDPLGPQNKMIFMAGPLTGTKMPANRYAVVGKSPLTGIYGESTSSYWGSQLKMAGYDGIIFEGSAKDPVYLWINDGDVEIRDASHLWELTVHEVGKVLKKEIKEKGFGALSIGPAGERLARLAGIIECYHGNAAARCGLGAVMGSKNLKAVVTRGTSVVKVADKKRFIGLLRGILKILAQNSESWRLYGTAAGVRPAEAIGDLPIKNWTVGSWPDGAKKISGETMTETILRRPAPCHGCPVACKRDIEIKEGPYVGTEGNGPEYETIGALGSMLLIDNLEAVAYGNYLCTAYGIDTISCGGVLAFAAECYEKGVITKYDTEGLDLTWGNSKHFIKLIEMIGERRGIGRLLGEGSRIASQKLGQGSYRFAIHVKGMELPCHDPRAYESLAIMYATANRGADHLSGLSYCLERGLTVPELGYTSILDRFVTEGKAEMVIKMQNFMSVMDSLIMCKFHFQCGVTYTHISQILSAVTGIDWTVEKLQEVGERIYNLKRLFNVREGISRKDDTIPQRILTKHTTESGAKDHVPDLERMLDEYYQIRGWNQEGIPTRETLNRLGLSR